LGGKRKAGAPRVHTQRFAFRAPQEDDESVKMSNNSGGRPSALPAALPATRPCAACLQNRQFLFDTNKSFSPNTNFSTYRKQSTSYFLFNTNQRSRITNAAAINEDFHVPSGRGSMVAEPFARKFNLSGKRKA
jgi:hypothetical protein